MQIFKIVCFLSCCSLLFTTCRKETKVSDNTNSFGTMIGFGSEFYMAEVLPLAGNNYIICGTKLAGEHGMDDGFAMKVDDKFNVIWYKNYGGAYEDRITSMAMDGDGNIMLSGFSYSFSTSVDTNYLHQNSQYYLIYIDKDGNKIWEKSIRANPTAKNVDNTTRKILYLNNNTFAVMGETINYTNNYDVYAFCVDKQANVIWTRRFFNPVLPGDPLIEEFCQYACLSEDGNIILQMRTQDFTNQTSAVKLVKTKSTGSGFTSNNYLWKGTDLTNLVTLGYELYNTIPMASCNGDKVAITDIVNKGIAITNPDGSIHKRIAFKNPLSVSNIYRNEENLIINGVSETSEGQVPSCIRTDLDGNILEEVNLKLDEPVNSNIRLTKAFFTAKNEIIVFGTLENEKGSNIVILKFDHNGKIINK